MHLAEDLPRLPAKLFRGIRRRYPTSGRKDDEATMFEMREIRCSNIKRILHLLLLWCIIQSEWCWFYYYPTTTRHRGGWMMKTLCTHENYETKKVLDFVFNLCLDCGYQWKFGNDPVFRIVDKEDTLEE